MARELQVASDLASKLLRLGDDLFAADQAWLEYRFAVNGLNSVLETRKEMIKDLPEANLSLKEQFKAAEDVLRGALEELSKPEKYAHRCVSCWGCAKAYAFPRTLDRRLQFIEKITTSIKGAIALEEEQRKAAEECRFSRGIVPSDNPARDARFVPPKNYQMEVYSALKDLSESSRLVVFLHGEQGIGKSTLAWHVASEASKSDGSLEGRDLSCFFSVVIFITCGTSKTAESVFQELKVRLKLDVQASDAELSRRIGQTKTLVILDDVQDSDIPPKVVRLAGDLYKSLKFLITSNVSTVCDHCEPFKIKSIELELGRIDEGDSWEILAKHTGFFLPEGRIPENLQGVVRIMGKVVEVTRGHPLALACFASQIEKDRVEDVHTWEKAWANLEAALSDESKVDVYQKYPRSFVATMKLSLKDLGRDARNLLLLFFTLEVEPVLEEALELLYVRLGLGTSRQFKKAAELLRARYLVSVREADEDLKHLKFGNSSCYMERLQHSIVHTMKTYMWYVHPLRRDLVKAEGVPMENKVDGKTEESIATIEDMGCFIKNKLNDVGEVKEDTNEEDALFAILCDYFVHRGFVPHARPGMMEWLRANRKPYITEVLLLLGRVYGELYEAAKKMILLCYSGKDVNVEDLIPLFQSDVAFASVVEAFRCGAAVNHRVKGLNYLENNVSKAELQWNLLLEVLAEGTRMGMNEKNVHKIKEVLKLEGFNWDQWDERLRENLYFRRICMIRSYPLIVRRIFDVLRLCSDVELGVACFTFLSLLSDERRGTVAGKLSIIHCRDLVFLMVESLESPPHPGILSAIVAVLINVVTIEEGCNLVTEKEGPVSSLVEEWCKGSGDRIFLERVGRFLVNIVVHEKGAHLMRCYLGAVMEKLQRLLSSLSEAKRRGTNRQIDTCICLLSNLAAFSEEYCLLIMDADEQSTISILMDVPVQYMTQTNVMLWINLIINLAKRGELRKRLQENDAVRRCLKQVYENYGPVNAKDLGEVEHWEYREVVDELKTKFGLFKFVEVGLEEYKYEWDDVFPDVGGSSWALFRSDVRHGSGVGISGPISRKGCQAEVLTLLNLEDTLRACISRFEEVPRVQVLIYLARAKAKLLQGEFCAAADDLKEAFTINRRNQPSDFIDLASTIRIEQHIMRRQCYLMTASKEWEKALQTATEMIHFDPNNFSSNWAEILSMSGEVTGISPEVSINGLIQRGMILRIMQRPHEALRAFDAALDGASKILKSDADSTEKLRFGRTSWEILKQRAEVRHILESEDAAKEDLLTGAKHLCLASSLQGIFRFNSFPHYLDQMPPSSFVSEFLNSNEFYEAMIVNFSEIDLSVGIDFCKEIYAKC